MGVASGGSEGGGDHRVATTVTAVQDGYCGCNRVMACRVSAVAAMMLSMVLHARQTHEVGAHECGELGAVKDPVGRVQGVLVHAVALFARQVVPSKEASTMTPS